MFKLDIIYGLDNIEIRKYITMTNYKWKKVKYIKVSFYSGCSLRLF